MNQIDFIDGVREARPARVIRNTRPSAAEEKAQLALHLGRLINTVPPYLASASIQATREWVAAQARAKKVVGNSRASANDLTMAIANMTAMARPARER